MYIGRFAPSPTGPLHFGSLVAALASWLQARSQNGRWLLRIEDLDPPREQAGASDEIIQTLEHYGLYWDGPILFQSQQSEVYEAALARLHSLNRLFNCDCSRKTLKNSAPVGLDGPVYPGHCRQAQRSLPAALRVTVDDIAIGWPEPLYGEQQCNLARDYGDFVLKRADGLYAYQLAVVIDDAEQGITEVVRGSDLLASTPRQIWLQHLLTLPQPHYIHLPLILTADGNKLSKQTGAQALSTDGISATLAMALACLGHNPPSELTAAPTHELLNWGIQNWNLARIPTKDQVLPTN